MPQVQIQRYEQILERMVSRMVSQTDLSDLTDSSIFKHILAACAREVDEVHFQLNRLTDLWSIDRAAGDDLDERAKDIQPGTLTRIGARAAASSVIFSRTSTVGDVTIPSGTVVKTADGVLFETTVQTQITAGNTDSVLTSVVAQEPGTSGNVDPNTIIKFGSKIPGVDSVTNPISTVPGRDEESDDDFRERIRSFVNSLARSTVDALEFVALGVEEESGKQVIFSHIYEDPIDPGKAVLYIDDGLGTAEEILTSSPSGDISDISAPDGGGDQTLTDNGEGLYTIEMIGRDVTVAGALAANNGTFPILDVPTANTLVYNNAGGSAETPGAATWAIGDEIVTKGLTGPPINSAVGGEEFLNLDNWPVKTETTVTITSSTRGALTVGSEVFINPSNGKLYFTPPLSLGEVIYANYTYFTGLIAAVQLVVDGDENDRDTYPGYRAAGINVRVLSPSVVTISVEAALVYEAGVDAATVVADAETAVLDLINNSGISNDIVRNEVIEVLMGVDGVVDLELVLPATNVAILDDEIPRATSASVNIT